MLNQEPVLALPPLTAIEVRQLIHGLFINLFHIPTGATIKRSLPRRNSVLNSVKKGN